MRNWRASAAYRIAFINFGASAVGLIALTAIVTIAMHIAFTRQLDTMVSDEASELQQEYVRGGDSELAKEIDEREGSTSPTEMMYAVFTPDGRKIHGSLQTARGTPGLHPIVFQDPKEGPDGARAMTVDLSPQERLIVAVDDDWLEHIELLVISIFGFALVGFIILSLGSAAVLGSYLQRRLQSISNSAEAIMGGDIRRRMPVSPHRDEFDQLAATLNRMLDRIEGLLENLRQVSSDIAHDLRTPLARLRNRLEEERFDEPPSPTVVTDAIRQVDEVLALFAAILRLAEVESGETKKFFEPVDLAGLLTELAESYAPTFDDQGQTLFWSVEPGLAVEGDRDLIAQAVVNLLENAKRHTPAGTIVRMTATSTSDAVNIQVVDNGPGVPEADIGRITKRFARVDSSRNMEGHGLGLSLVSAVAKLHGGRLILGNSAPGLSAELEIPKVQAGSGTRC